jgi:hypothetical protein
MKMRIELIENDQDQKFLAIQFVLTTMTSGLNLKVLLFLALVAAGVAVLPRCSFAGSSSSPTGQYRAGCMCRFADGTQKCVLKGPTGKTCRT